MPGVSTKHLKFLGAKISFLEILKAVNAEDLN